MSQLQQIGSDRCIRGGGWRSSYPKIGKMYARTGRWTYVFAAPDFNRSAGSIGTFVGVGFSRMLEGGS